MNPASWSTSIAQRDSGTSENVGARNPTTGVPASSSSRALPRVTSAANALGRQLGERLVAPAVQADLVPASRDLGDQVGMVVGDLADDEEGAARVAVVEEVEHLAGERGVALLGVG